MFPHHPYYSPAADKPFPAETQVGRYRNATYAHHRGGLAKVTAPGNHRVVFTQRLGRAWWPVSGIALLLLIALSIIDARRHHRGVATRMI